MIRKFVYFRKQGIIRFKVAYDSDVSLYSMSRKCEPTGDDTHTLFFLAANCVWNNDFVGLVSETDCLES